MNYREYKELHDRILEGEVSSSIYKQEAYLNYVRLNKARLNRWDKRMKLDQDFVELIEHADQPTHWILITEPWCGDAAHAIPFLVRMTKLNPHITYEIQLRDSEPHLINNYLTNGGKSIPKLIVRNRHQEDLFTWGPRPEGAQKLMMELKEQQADWDKINIAIQKWYNNDKGQSMITEIAALWKWIASSSHSPSALVEK